MVRQKREAAPEPDRSAPRYTIDLSLPPFERYKALAIQYQDKIHSLTHLFDDLLSNRGVSSGYHGYIKTAASYLLRGVHSPIETAELRGIAEVTGVSMYLLVALNVVLDLLMGCTSGGVQSAEAGQHLSQTRMLHFRTLDWGMDPLRDIVVQLDFVRSKSREPARVVASSVTYVGFVGVLIGVRQGLSMSLNFRAIHNAQTRLDHLRFYTHHLLVLFGRQPSISSVLRGLLLSETHAGVDDEQETKDLASICDELLTTHTTAAYLIFCDGQRTVAVDKDYSTAHFRESKAFIAATNHDVDEAVTRPNTTVPGMEARLSSTGQVSEAIEELIEDSRDRLSCVTKKWNLKVRRVQRQASKTEQRPVTENEVAATEAEVIKWLTAWPTTNESTHFGAVMDPTKGQIIWTKVYPMTIEE